MKIAVITCVNNEEEYAQALSYIDRLHVPDGYELDVIAVREAPSMAAGYQMAMEHTDARYKIYMHQDTFIINREFLRDMLSVFRSDDRIGAIGMVGCDDVPIMCAGGRICSMDGTFTIFRSALRCGGQATVW